MDAVSIGIFAGSFSSVLIILGGAITYAGGKTEFFTSGYGLYAWLVGLSALIIGVFIHTYIISNALAKLPTQSSSATVL